jgi:hypothetical protein
MTTIKNFKKSIKRDLYYPGIKLFQMDLRRIVEEAISKNEIQDEELKKLPSWQKFVKNPYKSRSFFTKVLQSVFLGHHSHDELNSDFQMSEAGEIRGKRRIAMMFLPHNTQVKNITSIEVIAKDSLPEYRIIKLTGMERATSNANAEKYVKEQLETYPNDNFLVISSQIGQRSFSVGEIDELYLAYDNGDNGATIQKMSRALTGHDLDKVGKIFSLSFDPNRDDKFSGAILQAADDLSKRRGSGIRTELKNVLSSVDIFSCLEEGAKLIQTDEFIQRAIDNSTMGKAITMMTPVETLPFNEIIELANGSGWEGDSEELEIARKGKTSDEKRRIQKKENKKERDLVAAARETILNIIENSDMIMTATGCKDIRSAVIKSEEMGMQSSIERRFEITFGLFKNLILEEKIKSSWIDCLYGGSL